MATFKPYCRNRFLPFSTFQICFANQKPNPIESKHIDCSESALMFSYIMHYIYYYFKYIYICSYTCTHTYIIYILIYNMHVDKHLCFYEYIVYIYYHYIIYMCMSFYNVSKISVLMGMARFQICVGNECFEYKYSPCLDNQM